MNGFESKLKCLILSGFDRISLHNPFTYFCEKKVSLKLLELEYDLQGTHTSNQITKMIHHSNNFWLQFIFGKQKPKQMILLQTLECSRGSLQFQNVSILYLTKPSMLFCVPEENHAALPINSSHLFHDTTSKKAV